MTVFVYVYVYVYVMVVTTICFFDQMNVHSDRS